VTDSGFLVRDGVELKWSRGHLPIAVLLDESAADYLPEFEAAAAAFHAAVFDRSYFSIGPFMHPSTAVLPALSNAFHDEKARASLRSTVLVVGDGPLDMRHLGSTDLRYDERNGQILNAIVLLPPRAQAIEALGLGDPVHGQQLAYQAALHELGHVLGLDHDDEASSIMWHQVRTDSTILLSGDVARLRAAYG
jgi:hypothetical protein